MTMEKNKIKKEEEIKEVKEQRIRRNKSNLRNNEEVNSVKEKKLWALNLVMIDI